MTTNQLTTGRPAVAPDTTTASTRRWTLFAASFGFLMVSLDATIVNVALPTLGDQLGANLSQLQWVVDGYTLTFAALQLVGGSLSDRLGARRTFGIGLCLFVAASLACGLALSPGMLVAARLVQGLGAAAQLPASLAMIRHAFPDGAARTRAVGVWAAAGGGAVAAGPVLGGLLLVWLGWRSLFLVNLLIGAAALPALLRAQVTHTGRPRRWDLPGQLLMAVGLGGLVFALIEGATLGWNSVEVVGAFTIAAASTAAFVRWERRAAAPLLPMAVFARPEFSAASVAGFVQNFAYYGTVFLLSLFLQDARHHSALQTGLVFLPMSLAAMTFNLVGGRLTARWGPRLPMTAGQVLFALGLLGLATAGPDVGEGVLWVATVAVGVGAGMVVPAMSAAVLHSVEPEYAGVASAALNTARQVGGAVGVALFGALVAGGFLSGLHVSLLVAAVALCLSSAVAARWARTRA